MEAVEGGEAAPSNVRSANRVKVYQLNHEGAWEDQGTGYAALINRYIVVYAEEEEKPSTSVVILEAPVVGDDVYQRQGDTIISWNDPNMSVDLALSFQESKQCSTFWMEVQTLQGRNIAAQHGCRQEDPQPNPDGYLEQQRLPEPSMETLGEIANIVDTCGLYQREFMAQAFARKEYLRQLFEQFSMCEDLDNTTGLSALFRIFKGMVMLNDNCLLELLLSEEYILSVIGVLEYDPELSTRTAHRDYLTKVVVFKEVVKIEDKTVMSNIHQNFRVLYLKDVILAKYLDDHTFSTLSTLVYFNSVEIVNRLQQDAAFLDAMFEGLLDPSNDNQRLKDLIGLLQELCAMAKNLQVIARGQFYRKLVDRNLFKVLEITVTHSVRSLRLSAVDIANGFISQESHLCRAHMMQQTQKCALLGLFVDQLFADNDAGMKCQLGELIEMLLDPERMEGTSEKDDFLNLFYEAFMEPLVSCVSMEQLVLDKMRDFRRKDPSGQCSREQMDSETTLVLATRNQVCEILAFCVQHHGYRIKYFILRHNIVQKALHLVFTQRKGHVNRHVVNNQLTLTVMRFVRACVGLKDEFYNRHLVKNNLFDPIMKAFHANGNRYNLFNSSVIELVDFCRRENVKSLVAHLVESHRDKFSNADYVSTFKDLVRKYEQNIDSERPNEERETSQQQQQAQPWRRMQESDDDAYFNESDSEENVEPPPALSASDMAVDIGPSPPPNNSLQNKAGGIKTMNFDESNVQLTGWSPTSPTTTPSAPVNNICGAEQSPVAVSDLVAPSDAVLIPATSPGIPAVLTADELSCPAQGPNTQDADGHITKRLKVDAS